MTTYVLTFFLLYAIAAALALWDMAKPIGSWPLFFTMIPVVLVLLPFIVGTYLLTYGEWILKRKLGWIKDGRTPTAPH